MVKSLKKRNSNQIDYSSSTSGKYIEVKPPFTERPNYELELQRAAKRKTKVKRPVSPSYMEETHLGGRLERVPGFDIIGAMADRSNPAAIAKRNRSKTLLGQNAADTFLKSGEEITAESVFNEGGDWSFISETSSVPWRSVCHLEITYQSGRTAVGTGWMAGPDTIITAGHNVLSREGDGWATEGIRIIPGRNSGIWPFDETWAVAFDAMAGWVSGFDPKFDLGMIKLADPNLGYRTGWFGYSSFSDKDLLSAPILNNVGYPSLTKPYGTQWYDASRVKSFTDEFIRYRLDTEAGLSGSPIFFSDFHGQRLVVATHVYGAASSNLGLRINNSIFSTINGWVGS